MTVITRTTNDLIITLDNDIKKLPQSEITTKIKNKFSKLLQTIKFQVELNLLCMDCNSKELNMLASDYIKMLSRNNNLFLTCFVSKKSTADAVFKLKALKNYVAENVEILPTNDETYEIKIYVCKYTRSYDILYSPDFFINAVNEWQKS